MDKAPYENYNGSGCQSDPRRDVNPEVDISEEIEKYLGDLSIRDTEFVDPKLKREKQRLLDLLTSYKKLSEQLDKKCEEAAKHGIEIPKKEILTRRAEIRALLHPELYRNPREEEKKKLIEKFSTKRVFSEVDKVFPPDFTPVHAVSDRRQAEKDRFCRLVASAPTRFNNILSEPSGRFKRVTRPPTTPKTHIDVREQEKDRLARIFATSAAFIRDPNLKRKVLQKYKQKNSSHSNTPEPSAAPQVSQRAEREMCIAAQTSKENYPSLSPDLNEMVRIGEYSPLNKQSSPSQGRTVLGVGENEEKKKLLNEERRREYRDYRERDQQTKLDKAVMVSIERLLETNERRSVSSASTQTDDSLSDAGSPVQNVQVKFPSPQRFEYITPREKLLSDLHGSRPPGEIAQDEKSKRIAYAKALEEQINEKKRLDDEKKRREREEEELGELRYREQAERLQKEYDHERHQKLDFVLQLQSQEVMRKKLAEMDLEAKELKKQERLKRLRDERSPTRPVVTANLAAALSALQGHENGTRKVERELAGMSNPSVLPERLPEPDWDEDWSKMTKLEGVDLLREHRSQKERLQLPPVVDPTNRIERKNGRIADQPQPDAYVPSSVNDATRRPRDYRQQAEAILKAPIDAAIIHPDPPERSAVSLPPPRRSRSPVLPAVRTESMLKRNSRILDDKWKVPTEVTHELGRTIVDRDNILTQLGAFRRQLAQEHHKLEERIRGQSS